MKKMIIISMFLGIVCSKGYGQFNYNTITDSVSLNFDSTRLLEWRNGVVVDSFPENKFTFCNYIADTIPVIILYCDTSERYRLFPKFEIDYEKTKQYADTSKSKYASSIIFGKNSYDTLDRHRDYSTYWMNAYYVISDNLKYLDADKKELPKKIIVWQHQPLNKNE